MNSKPKNKYLQLLEQFRVTPNFWCSKEYFDKAKLQTHQDGNWIYVWDEENSITAFPPIHVDLGPCPLRGEQIWAEKFWSDFPSYYPGKFYKTEFLDLEYIYDPKEFLNMEGSKWSTFRKNCRKFPNRIQGSIYITPDQTDKQTILDLIRDWLGDKEPQELEIMIDYALNGENRRILVGDELYGINIWDDNWARINYRFCICRPGTYYISEYMRWLFYTDPIILGKNKLINDGGILDNPSLKFFKDKLNPVAVRQVNTWIKI